MMPWLCSPIRLPASFSDPDHSEGEQRELIVGYDAANYLLFVSFTERDGNVRLISARRATAKERHAYETYLK